MSLGRTVAESIMSKLDFLYGVSPITGFFALLIGILWYLPNQFVAVLPQVELIGYDGIVVKVEGLLTAEQLCREQLNVRYGDRLMSTTLDRHSSRFDMPRDLFLIFMRVSVGPYSKHEDFRVHCHVEIGGSQVAYLEAFEIRKPWVAR
jgi:hypothetical protein